MSKTKKLRKGWKEIALKILQEEEVQRRKLDKLESNQFILIFFYKTSELMKERKLLHCKIVPYSTSQGVGKKEISEAKVSAAQFLVRLKSKEPARYRKLLKDSLTLGRGSQKQHKYLIEMAKRKLEKQQYKVYEGEDPEAIQRLRDLDREGYLVTICRGKRTYPDLLAFKGEDVLAIEVWSHKRQLVKKLHNYLLAAKTVLVMPISTDNLKVWGTSELFEDST